MRGQGVFRNVSRDDVCIFCALRLGSSPPHPSFRRTTKSCQRLFRTSTSSNRPSATAYAVAENDVQNSPQPAHQPSTLSKAAPQPWPTFVPKRPLPPPTLEAEENPSMTASSWQCLACGNVNLARRSVCSRCSKPKTISIGQQAQSGRNPKPKWGQLSTQDATSSKADPPCRPPTLRPSRLRLDLEAGHEEPPIKWHANSIHSLPIRTIRASAIEDAARAAFNNKQSEGSSSSRRQHQENTEFRSPQQRSQSEMLRSVPQQNVDAGNQSGLQALLDYSGSSSQWSSRTHNPATRGSAIQGGVAQNFARNQLQYGAVADNASTFLPFGSTSSGRGPALRTGTEESPQNRFEVGNVQRDGNEPRRSRGRFHVEIEDVGDGPQGMLTRSRPQRQKKNARRASRISQEIMNDPEEELLLERQSRKKRSKDKSIAKTPSKTSIQLPEFISVKNLAAALRVRTEDFISRMEEMGFDTPRHDHILDAETSELIASEFNYEPTFGVEDQMQDLVARPSPKDISLLPPRPPIVTIMGHVDHGKTTILDWLRKSSVAASEHGGITQHIGAFSVAMPTGKRITFLDTPGHAAFLDMRRRGANVTDIVILVVAADDSVKPQTIEAIKHATDAKVPMIVAMNKVDKEDSDVDSVKQDLAALGVAVEDYGGDVQAIPVSGKFGKGMAELEEATLALSEMLDHRAEMDGPVEGWIIESKVTLAGRAATVLVRKGTLRPGDIVVAGTTWARVRSLRNDAGSVVDEAPPGTPVQIDGWRADDPIAGQEVLQAIDEEHAKDVAELRRDREERTKLAGDTAAINATRAEEADARAQQLAWEAEQVWASRRPGRRPKDNVGWVEGKGSSGPRQIHFVVKADVSGSVEAVVNSVSAIGNNEIAANVISGGVGVINESDVQHLASSGERGHLISFNQPVDAHVSRLAEAAGLEILNHNIIYKLTDSVREKLSAEMPPTVSQKVLGEAEIGKVFEISAKKKRSKIAGCKIKNGMITRHGKFRVLRRDQVVYDGTLESLKNVKKDVTEMKKGSECGIGFEGWDDFIEGDQIQCYREQKTARKL